jgi:protein-disulfide isomerase
MKTRKNFVFLLILFLLPLAIAGCIDKKRIEEIEKTQKEILNKINTIEANQKEMMKFFRPRRPTIDYNKVYNLPIGSSPVKGKKDAPVTIVEFSDFQCPYCARLQATLKQVLQAYPDEVKLVYKDFPLSFHKQARNAAKAARAAGEQGKYWEMHDLIFENYSSLSEEKFNEFAIKLNLDVNKFMKDFNSNKYDALIQQDINLGRSVGVTGTPTLFINGKRMRSRSFEAFKATIESYIKKK